MRRVSKLIKIGNCNIGNNEKISIQSMLNISPCDINKNIEAAKNLKNIGCDILRVAIPDMNSVKLIYEIKNKVDIPLVADIHFDYKLALESVYAGVDKIRINPGNIGNEFKVKKILDACKLHNIPIRIGVNSGSIEKNILKKYKHPTAEALCESAMHYVSVFEKYDFDNIVLSLKSSNVRTMVAAYRLVAQKCEYPLHLGVTETGSMNMGIIKSSIGIGSLLLDGIGDTIRVSLTADPIEEIKTAKNILKSLGLQKNGVEIISCPTCGRTKINIIKLVNELEKKLENCKKNVKIAVMGCAVNGPGEAKEADFGVAGGDGEGLIFSKGKIIKKVKEMDIIEELIKEIDNYNPK